MTRLQRFSLFGAGAAGLFLVATLGLWFAIGRAGGTRLEQWIGRYLVSVLNAHLTPQIAFQEIDYQAPRTVVVDGLTLTAEGRSIMRIGRALLELAEIPREGRPILVQRIELSRPQVSLVNNRAGGLVGWQDFVRPDVRRGLKSVPPGRRFSDMLVLRHIAIQDGQLIYDAADGSEPMTLPGIEMQLETPPAAEPGWYKLVGSLQRQPIFRAELDGQVNVDTALLEVARLQMRTTLSEEEYGTLPPALQRFMREHQIHGRLAATAQGRVVLKDPARSVGQVQASLSEGRFAYGGFTVPVGQLEVSASWPEGRANVRLAELGTSSRNQPIFSIRGLSFVATGLGADSPQIRFEQVQADGPRVVLARRGQGTYAGWSELAAEVEGEERRSPEVIGQLAGMLPAITIRDAGVRYEPLEGQPIEITGVDADVKLTPEQGKAESYLAEGEVTRHPVLAGRFRGRLDAAKALLGIERFEISGRLEEQALAALPKQAADAARHYALRGEVAVAGSAEIPLEKPSAVRADAELTVNNAGIAFKGLELPVKRLQVAGRWPSAPVRVEAEGIALRSGSLGLLEIERLAAELPEVPARLPMQIEKVTAQRVTARLITDEQGLIGWEKLEFGSDEPPVTIKRLEISGGEVVYGTKDETIRVPSIQLTATADPQDRDKYRLQARARPEDAAEDASDTEGTEGSSQLTWKAAAEGLLDLGGDVLRLDALRVEANLGARGGAAVPLPVKGLLERHQVQGRLAASLQGSIPLKAEGSTQLQIDGEIARAAFALGGTTWPVERIHGRVNLPDGPAEITAERLAVRSGREQMLAVNRAMVRLDTLPGEGKPIDVSMVRLDSPRMSLVRRNGRLAGWSDLWSGQREDVALVGSPQRPATQPGGRVIVSRVEVENAAVVYDPGDGGAPMSLTGIAMQLRIPPGDREGWYQLAGHIRRAPILDASVNGRINLDRSLLELRSLELSATLGEQQYETLPPELQQVLREHEIRGQLTATVAGRFPLKELTRSEAELKATLQNGRVALESSVWPVDRLSVTGRTAAGKATLDYQAQLVGGTGSGTLNMGLGGSQPVELTWRAQGLDLEQLSRTMDAASRLSGALNSQGRLRTSLGADASDLSGTATVNISNGRLIHVPLLREIVRLFAAPLRHGGGQDSADLNLQLGPDAAQVSGEVRSPVGRFRGEGTVSYDSSLDLRIQAEVMGQLREGVRGGLDAGRALGLRGIPRVLGRAVGEVGEAITGTVDRVVTYHVGGTLSAPRVTVRPLGL